MFLGGLQLEIVFGRVRRTEQTAAMAKTIDLATERAKRTQPAKSNAKRSSNPSAK